MNYNLETVGLADLIAPMTLKEFFSEYFEKKTLHISRNKEGYFNDILSMDRLDSMLSEQALHFPKVKMVNYKEDIDPSRYSDDQDINPGKLVREYAKGSTIVFGGLHHNIQGLKLLTDNLGKEFRQKFQTNIYLTPPQAQGFKIHYDSHDVIVLQIEGTKHWKIYNQALELPMKMQPFEEGQYPIGDLSMEFTMEPGDVLYIPRGIYHEALSTDKASLHITTGLLGFTWADFLIEGIMDLAKQDARFRRYLPPNYPKAVNDERLEGYVKHLLDIAKEKLDMGGGFRRFEEEYLSNSRPSLRGHLNDIHLGDIDASTSLVRRENIAWRIETKGETVSLRYNGIQVDFPTHVTSVLNDAVRRDQPFTSNDLLDELDEDGRLVLCQRLVWEGFLKRA